MTLAELAFPVQVLSVTAAAVVLIPLAFWGLAKVWSRPAFGVVATIVATAAPWRTGGEDEALVHLTLADIASVVLVVVVLTRVLLRPSPTDEARLGSWVLFPLVGLMAAATLATFAAADGLASLSGAVRQAQLLVLVPLAAYLAIQRRSDLRLILSSLLGLGLIQAVIGIYQYATDTGASFGGEDVRAIGTFGAYTIMAYPSVVSSALLVAVACALTCRGQRRAWALGAVALLLVGLGVSLSRGSWLAAVLAVVVMVAVSDWRRGVGLLALGGVGLAALMAFPTGGPVDSAVVDRLTGSAEVVSSPDQSVRDRYALWDAAEGMWRDHPVTGVGLKNFASFRDSYVGFDFSGRSDVADARGGFRQVALLTPHNQYLLVLAEQGLVGFFAHAVLFVSLGWAAFRRVRRELRGGTQTDQSVFGLTVLGLVVFYLVTGIYGDAGGAVALIDSVVLFGGLLWLASGSQPVKGAGSGEPRVLEDVGTKART
jgi:O-antigen ligase